MALAKLKLLINFGWDIVDNKISGKLAFRLILKCFWNDKARRTSSGLQVFWKLT